MTIEGPLPTVDAGSILQEESIQALKARLPLGEYLFRDERMDDYGVDGALELRSDGKATNIRAQIQIKGRSNTRANAAGVIGVPIATSNVNYLLNGICPLYVLFRSEMKELRFAFARDEWARLKAENPSWMNQQTVTIYFHRVLTNDALAELRKRIIEEAELQRSVNERLNELRGASGTVVIDGPTLAVSDSNEALRLLSQIGQLMTNAGLATAVIERGRTIPSDKLLASPRAALAVAYAHFHLAHYHDASAALRRLLVSTPGLGPEDQSLLDVLFISTKRMLGELDQGGYEREMEEWSKKAPAELAIQYDIARAWSRNHHAIATSAPADERSKTQLELRAAFERGRAIGGTHSLHHIELLELTLEQHEVEDSMLDASALQDIAKRGGGDVHHAEVVAGQAGTRALEWFDKLTSLAQRTAKVSPQSHCEVRLLHNHAVLARASKTQLMAATGHGRALAQEAIASIFEGIEETLGLACALENRELELSAKQDLVKAMDTFGRATDATAVATEALKVAELSGCPIHAKQLREFLTGEDRFADRLHQLKALATTSEEDMIRGAGDDQLSFMAGIVAAANHVPKEHEPNLLQSLRCQRQLAQERRDWCRHIAHGEYQRDDPSLRYAQPPLVKIVCTRFEHEAPADAGDVTRLTADFRAQHCRGCRARQPDSRTALDVRAVRNRAKADRRKRRRNS
jgi:hypothetical protein